MRAYEALVIVDPGLEEGDIEKAVQRFSDTITEAGGEVSKVDRWGVRRFAFELDHRKEGYYFLTNFRASEGLIAQLERTIQISDEFIRGKITRPG